MRTGTGKQSNLQALLQWCGTNTQVQVDRLLLEEEGKPAGVIWKNFSCIQVPASLLQYGGSPAAHVALHLYDLGAGKSFRAEETGYPVRVKVKTRTLSKESRSQNRKTLLSLRAVSDGFDTLEHDGYIEREAQRTARGRMAADAIYPLDPFTRKRLETHPGTYGLLSANTNDDERHFHFITVPRDCLKQIDGMEYASDKAVYLSALALVSKACDECVAVERPLWQALSNVSPNSFRNSLKRLKAKGLLSYRRGVLEVHDPMTGKPTERWKHDREFVHHENTQWKFDLNKDVTPEGLHAALVKAWRQNIPFFEGWALHKDLGCPYCGEIGKFSLSFDVCRGGFRCRACSDGHGKMGQLIQHLLGGVDWDAVKEFIEVAQQDALTAQVYAQV